MNVQEQFLGTIAFAGDLTMGQPPDHSPTTACLAARIARDDGATDQVIERSAQLAMIRWAGCTANAQGFADLFGDDIAGRHEILAARDPFVAKPHLTVSTLQRLASRLPFFPNISPETLFYGKVTPLVYSHCEVAGEIARRGQFSNELIAAIDDLFEYWDGSGWPLGKQGHAFDPSVQYVWLANDIEAFCRFHGPNEAEQLIRDRMNVVYRKDLAEHALTRMSDWLAEVAAVDPLVQALEYAGLKSDPAAFEMDAAIELLADFAALKRPHILGISRKGCDVAEHIAEAMGEPECDARTSANGAMLCTLGYVAISSAALHPSGKLNHEDRRLVPYWTERILSRAPDLADATKVASQVFERLDGSGWHRELRAPDLSRSARIAQVAMVASEYVISEGTQAAISALRAEAEAGKLDHDIVAVCISILGNAPATPLRRPALAYGITRREQQVLLQIVAGQSNKEIARALGVSPKTVNTHLENCFRKMNVRTRSAAAIKALEAGIVFRWPADT